MIKYGLCPVVEHRIRDTRVKETVQSLTVFTITHACLLCIFRMVKILKYLLKVNQSKMLFYNGRFPKSG